MPLDELLKLSLERLKDRNDDIDLRNSAAKVVSHYGNEDILEDLRRLLEAEKEKLTTNGVPNIQSADIEFLSPLTNAILGIEEKNKKS